MTTEASETHRTTATIPPKAQYFSKQQRTLSPNLYNSPQLSVFILSTCVIVLTLLQIHFLHTPTPYSCPSSTNCTPELAAMAAKLSRAVTFLPLKDLRYSQAALQGHTWFMSSTNDTHANGGAQYQHFPSAASQGRLLCLKGRDGHDGARNSYALAWPEALPYNATLMKNLTFVSYNHYDYENLWHGLSAVVPFVAWHAENGCTAPSRWVLYHRGELRTRMGTWLSHLVEATFGGGSGRIEGFEGVVGSGDAVACFEEAVVMRHNEGGMSRERRMEVYDLLRCKARLYCNVSVEGDRRSPVIAMTLFMRTGARSFRNESAVVGMFERECGKVNGCRLRVAHSNNLSFCEQVKLMSLTDILVSPHGAQLTNMFLMDRNSSVMEFFPKGWLQLAGIGQYVYHWIASWSGMRHEGTWRDLNGENCPYPEDDQRCMSIFKKGRIGHNETYFTEWARNVLGEVKTRKRKAASQKSTTASSRCACS